MNKKTEIITRLLEAKHITVEEAMELMKQEKQQVNVWPQRPLPW